MNKMNILFIGGIYERNEEKNYIKKSKAGIQLAVNTHQWNMIDGLINNKKKISVLSARFVHEYPIYKEVYLKKNKWNEENRLICENIGFINIKGLKQLWRYKSLEKKAQKWAKDNIKGEIICYYTNIPFMNAAIQAKKINPNIKITLVVPDIPSFLNLSENLSKRDKFIYKLTEKKAQKLVAQFDKYILLTEAMKKILPIGEKPYIVIEGMIRPSEVQKSIKNNLSYEKIIMYSGSLHNKYGIVELVEAFKKIPDVNYKLLIFGDGEYKENIIKESENDKRIQYFGYKDRSIILEHQRKATVLINPRKANEEFTKYSFPSKNMEYLASGTPIIAYRMDGVPQEYYKYMYIPEDESIEALAKKITEICETNDKRLAEEAKEFIIKEKNINIQCKKIIELIEG